MIKQIQFVDSDNNSASKLAERIAKEHVQKNEQYANLLKINRLDRILNNNKLEITSSGTIADKVVSEVPDTEIALHIIKQAFNYNIEVRSSKKLYDRDSEEFEFEKNIIASPKKEIIKNKYNNNTEFKEKYDDVATKIISVVRRHEIIQLNEYLKAELDMQTPIMNGGKFKQTEADKKPTLYLTMTESNIIRANEIINKGNEVQLIWSYSGIPEPKGNFFLSHQKEEVHEFYKSIIDATKISVDKFIENNFKK